MGNAREKIEPVIITVCQKKSALMEDRFGKDGDHEIEPPECGGFRVNSFVIKRSNYPNKPRRYDNVGDPYVF